MKKYSWMLITAFFLLYPNHAYSQWMQTRGPAGGVVNTFAVSGKNIFAGTYTGGVFLSTNNRARWTAAGLKNQSIFSLAVNESYLFVGTTDSTVWRRPLSDFNDASTNDTKSNGSGCGAGASLALLPPLWFKVQSSSKRKRSSRREKHRYRL